MSGAGSADTHSVSVVATIWVITFIRSLAYSAGIALALFAFAQMLDGRLKYSRLYMILPIVGLTFFSIRNEELFICLPLVAIWTALLGQRLSWNLLKSKSMRVVITGTLFAATFAIGSNNGFLVSLFAYWVVFPFLLDVAKVKERKTLVMLVLCSIAFVSVYRGIHPYWDSGIHTLRCQFANESVHGIRSRCDRVKETEEIINAVVANSTQTDKIFVAQSSPGLYVLTNRSVWGHYPWPYTIPPEEVGEMFASPHEDYPKLVILEKLNVLGRGWPNPNVGEPLEYFTGQKKHFPIYLHFIEQHKYSMIFENRTWMVFSKK